MKKINKFIITLVISLIVCLPLICSQAQSNGNLESEYQKLVKQLKQFPIKDLKNFDYFNFRKIAFQSGHMQESINDDLEDQYHAALNNKNYGEAIGICEKILDKDYTNSKFHTMKSYFHIKLGSNKEITARNYIIARGLRGSILAAGDGRSFDTAWHVFLVREEYDLLKHLGFFTLIQQNLVYNNDKPYDVLDAQNKKGETRKFYFDISDVPSMNIMKEIKQK